MQFPQFKYVSKTFSLAFLMLAAACHDNEPIGHRISPQFDGQVPADEGEFFGKIIGATTNDYYVEIRPLSDLDDDWVVDSLRHSWSMWADTARHKVPGDTLRRNGMFEWIDPMEGGLCGSLSEYQSGAVRIWELVRAFQPAIIVDKNNEHSYIQYRPHLAGGRIHS